MTSSLGNLVNAQEQRGDLQLDGGNDEAKDKLGVQKSRGIVDDGRMSSISDDDNGLYEVDPGLTNQNSLLIDKSSPLGKQSFLKDSDNGRLDAVHAVQRADRVHLAHRHELYNSRHESHAVVSGIIWALVVLHLVGLVVWLRAWNRQRRSKDPTMKAHILAAPPQKVACNYDLDKTYLPKIELPMKALSLKHSQA